MTKQIPPASIFPPTWRECCFRVVQIYLELQEKETGRKLGSTRLARAMRELHVIHGNDWANARLEEEFTRQDVEAWLNRGVEFSDRKFKFVDAFVRKIAVGGCGKEIRQIVADEKETRLCGALLEVFGNTNQDAKLDWANKFFKAGMTWRCGVGSNWDGMLRIKSIDGRVCRGDVVFFSKRETLNRKSARFSEEKLLSSAKHFRAYFVCLGRNALGYEKIRNGGILFVRDPAFQNIKFTLSNMDSTLFSFSAHDDTVIDVVHRVSGAERIMLDIDENEDSAERISGFVHWDASHFLPLLDRATAGYLL